MIAQFRTEAVMRERLAELGHRPHFGRQLAGFEQDETASPPASSMRGASILSAPAS
jgi:hypothetical protein